MSIGAHVEAGGVTAPGTCHPTAPAVALTYTDGTSALLEFVGIDNSTNQVLTWDPPPAGYSLATPGRFHRRLPEEQHRHRRAGHDQPA